MKKVIVGIDPGNEGAIVIRNGDEIDTIIMPLKDGQVCESELSELFREIAFETKHVYLEDIYAVPTSGASSMLNFGRGHGKIVGILAALHIPYTLIRPQVWQRAVINDGKSGDTKLRALKTAQRLFPQVELKKSSRAKLPHSGIVDALLISEYGVRNV